MKSHLREIALFFSEHAATRVLDALTTVVLLRILNVESLGLFVLYQSWAALILVGLPAMENMLYREYGAYRSSGHLSREIDLYRKFNWLKLAVALVLVFALARSGEGWGLALALGLPLSQSLYGIYREPLRFEGFQDLVVGVSSLQKLVLLCVVYYFGQRAGGDLASVARAALVVFILFGGVWKVLAYWKLPIKRTASERRDWPASLKQMGKNLVSTILWMHLIGATMSAVQTLDVFFLGRAGRGLSEIAVYSLALKAANFFQLFALPLSQAFGVYLGRSKNRDEKKEKKLVWNACVVFCFAGLSMIVAAQVLSPWALAFLARGKFSQSELSLASEYFLWMTGGVAAMSASFAHGTYLMSRGNPRRLFFRAMLPWTVFSTLGYWWAANSGAMIAAKFNLAVGAAYSLAYIAFFSTQRRK